MDKVFNKNASQDNAETPSDAFNKDAALALSSSPDVITDELEHNSNVFDDNNYCNDETVSKQLVSSDKDEGYKMAAVDSNPPAEEQSLLSANANDEFAVDLSRILNICDDIEVLIYFYIYFNVRVCACVILSVHPFQYVLMYITA